MIGGSLHIWALRLLAAMLLLALVAVPPLALAMSAAPAPMVALQLETAADCTSHHVAGEVSVLPQAPAKAADNLCKAGCAACDSCTFVSAAMLPSTIRLPRFSVAILLPVENPRLHPMAGHHPPLRPPSI